MNNINNKLITKKIVTDIIFRYTNKVININNIKKFQKAFIHKSVGFIDPDNSDSDNYCVLNIDFKSLNNNERFETLGDKVIDLITLEYLFDKFPNENEGFLTTVKSRLVKKESLSVLGEKIGFRELMMISSHIERITSKTTGRNTPRFLEDIFESFMGVLYKDQNRNLDLCRDFLLGVYNKHVDLNHLINTNDNFKTILGEYYHSKGWGHPDYSNNYFKGSVKNREFTVFLLLNKNKLIDVNINEEKYMYNIIKEDSIESEYDMESLNNLLIDNVIIGIGKSNTKKNAEQLCCKNSLENLRIKK